MEFCDPEEFQIILATDVEHYDIYTLKELLPLGFGQGNQKEKKKVSGGPAPPRRPPH